jgi:hypothetical protein
MGQAAASEGMVYVGLAHGIDNFLLPACQQRLYVLGGEH